jgi:hypothetical protein
LDHVGLPAAGAGCRECNSRRGAELVNAGRPRPRRRVVTAEQAVIAYGARERAFWAAVERERRETERRPRRAWRGGWRFRHDWLAENRLMYEALRPTGLTLLETPGAKAVL